MDGKQRRDVALSVAGRGDEELRDVLRLCSRTLRDVRMAKDPAEIIEQYRRLDEFGSALDTVRTRLQLAVVLGSVPGVVSGPGRPPINPEALARLRRAINVIARRDT
jgi:hypothetical protein